MADYATRWLLGTVLVAAMVASGCSVSINTVTVSLAVKSVDDFFRAEVDSWVDSPVGPVFGGYVDPTPNQTRWFRFGLSADRHEPGTLLVLFDYQQLDQDFLPVPAPPDVLAGWNELATLIAQYLIRSSI